MERWLDAGHGSCVLKNTGLRSMVSESLQHFQGIRYDMDAWVVMPNHVHVLVRPRDDWSLECLLHTWKSFTANRLNKVLVRTGSFWMDETFDHIVRSEAQLAHYLCYIRENPAKARLPKGQFTLWEREGDKEPDPGCRVGP